MIEEHIKFHEEAKPVSSPTNYQTIAWNQKSEEQKNDWLATINKEYLKAVSMYQIGDHISLKTNAACVVEIVRFETDPEKVISYMGLPCIIKGAIKTWQSPSEIAYSLPELDWATLVPVKTTPLLLGAGANDE